MARRVVAVAHFPPPVHGMAVAVDHLVGELERRVPVRRVSISAPALDRSVSYHLRRAVRVLWALAVLTAERRRTPRVLFSCDAGPGMVYTLVLVAWGRLCGYRMHLQHHSYAYLTRRSSLAALLVGLAGPGCTHLVSCPRMRHDFSMIYPRAVVRVVGIAAGLPLPAARRAARPLRDRLVLGYLGNVCLEKGVDLAVETARAANRSGLPVELRVAGPVVDPVARDLLSAAAADSEVAVTVSGPVYGPAKAAFLDDLDVFLFPSRYPHESFGLVVWEAMARGVPVVAHRAGCLTDQAVGDAGVVLEPDHDFAAAATDTLRRWWQDTDALAAAGRAAAERAGRSVEASRRDVGRFCDGFVDEPGPLRALPIRR